MVRSVTVNIGGHQFTIEQEANLVLRNYIKTFEDHFRDVNDLQAVIGNIEIQISE